MPTIWLATIVALAALCGACAMGNASWVAQSGDAEVRWRGAGDSRCSIPGPLGVIAPRLVTLRACLPHDAAYELARRTRCLGEPDPEGYASPQARLVADLNLQTQMAQDGEPEWLAWAFYQGVRLFGWRTWYFGSCG